MLANLQGELTYNHALARYTTWHVGGPAKRCYRPVNLLDLQQFIQIMPNDEPYCWLGLGSNVLVRDLGFAGTVILTQGRLNDLAALENGIVRAEAGVTCAKLAKFCSRQGFEEASFFAGVPGTVGGALAMNAGAFGGETWSHVVAVEMMNQQGEIIQRPPQDFSIAYREVKRPDNEWFVAGHFQFNQGAAKQAEQHIKALLKKRNQTQPVGTFNCGSVFRNPPGDFAARLIEHCGLKGKRIGGAHISEKHANFIINDANATANDIESLIEAAEEAVFNRTGVRLVREVHIIGTG